VVHYNNFNSGAAVSSFADAALSVCSKMPDCDGLDFVSPTLPAELALLSSVGWSDRLV
jgi:hypothetical protein